MQNVGEDQRLYYVKPSPKGGCHCEEHRVVVIARNIEIVEGDVAISVDKRIRSEGRLAKP